MLNKIFLLLTLVSPLARGASAKTLFDFKAATIDGAEKPLAQFKTNAILVVNSASECGYTPQYKGLQELYQKYSARGFTILAFPSNDFGGQEPGTNAEIKKFCDLRYKVKFPLFSKAPVSGVAIQPLFAWLTTEANPALKGEVAWNFEKFLLDGQGRLVARYKSKITPSDTDLAHAIEALLPSTP